MRTEARGRVERLHGWLLGLYPPSFHTEWRDAMTLAFAERLGDAGRRGRLALLSFIVREFAGTVAGGMALRLSERRRRRGVHPIRIEIRQAIRRLVRAPGFTLTTVLTLSIAIGVTAALLTLVRGVVLSDLPYPDARRLLILDHSAIGLGYSHNIALSEAMYAHYVRGMRELDGLAVWQTQSLSVRARGDARAATVTRATSSLADVLSVRPRAGRWFNDIEATPDGPRVAVLGNGIWQREYGADASVVGETIVINGAPHEIIGVMPATFAFPDDRTEVWIPSRIDLADPRVGGLNWIGIGRMKPGSGVAAVRRDIDRLLAGYPEAFPASMAARELVNTAKLASVAVPAREYVAGSVAGTLWTLFGAALLVLFAACANVANLFLVRAESRQRDVAVRRVLGAGRVSVAGYFLAESFVLAAAATTLGLVLAAGSVTLLVRFGPESIPRLHEVGLDAPVFALTALLGLVIAIAFGSVRGGADSASLVRESGRTMTAARSRAWFRIVLMGAQVAFALMLMIGSMLLLRSFVALHQEDPGFDVGNTLVFDVSLPASAYPSTRLDDRARTAGMQSSILQRIATLPGITAVSATTCLPFDGICWGDPILVEGAVKREGSLPPVVGMRRVAGGLSAALGLRVTRGRDLEAADQGLSGRVVVINQALADAYFRDIDPLGRRLYPDFGAENPEWYTVVGVVDNTPTRSLSGDRMPELYMPLHDHTEDGPPVSTLSYVVRSAGDPLALASAIRRVIREVSPDLPMSRTRSIEQVVAEAGAQTAFVTMLVGFGAVIALVLGIVGIYGVIAYIVSRRTREIGVRIAIGATSVRVTRQIVIGGAAITGAGIAVGLAGALLTGRAVEALLFNVSAHDVTSYVTATLVLFGLALAACWIPARRISRIDPLEALRTD